MAFTVALDPASRSPLHEQIYATLKRAIENGQLPRGAKLPSTRALAELLNVSRNTVSAAYSALSCEGFIHTQRGATTKVCFTPPDPIRIGSPARSVVLGPASPLSRRGESIAESRMRQLGDHQTSLAFRLGVPALDVFPADEWEEALRRRWKRSSAHLLSDSDRRGHAPLREAIASYLSVARGLEARAEQIILVAGAQQAFSMILPLLIDPGDRVLVEDPGYPASAEAVRAALGLAVALPVDDEGANVSAVGGPAEGSRVAIVTPANQFPLGVPLSLSRRTALIAWARAVDGWIIEDDYDGEFRYTGKPLPALAASAPERVLYVGTFSKVFAPSLRLGYVVAPERMVDAVLAAKTIFAARTPTLEQAALGDFIESGAFSRHIRRMRNLYQGRRDSFAVATQAALGRTPRPVQAGMHAVLDLDVSAVELAAMARRDRIVVTPLSEFAIERAAPNALVLGFAPLAPAVQRRELERLAAIVARVESSSPTGSIESARSGSGSKSRPPINPGRP